jgi:THAP domain-containing protein 1/3
VQDLAVEVAIVIVYRILRLLFNSILNSILNCRQSLDYSKMVYKCAGFGCRSGYRDCSGLGCNGEKITFHSFPISNDELCQKWVRANPREGYTPTKHSRLCSLHFQSSDFIEEPQDKNVTRRKKSESSAKPFRRYLKEDAIPSIFPSAPSYLSKTCALPRSTSRATTSSRSQLEEKRLDSLEQCFLEKDKISGLTISELKERLQSETTVPEDFNICITEQSLLVYLINVTEDIPKITGSIIVRSDFTMAVTVDEKVVPATQYHDLVKGPLRCMSQLVNLMARVKAWIRDTTSRTLAGEKSVKKDLCKSLVFRCFLKVVSNVEFLMSEGRLFHI